MTRCGPLAALACAGCLSLPHGSGPGGADGGADAAGGRGGDAGGLAYDLAGPTAAADVDGDGAGDLAIAVTLRGAPGLLLLPSLRGDLAGTFASSTFVPLPAPAIALSSNGRISDSDVAAQIAAVDASGTLSLLREGQVGPEVALHPLAPTPTPGIQAATAAVMVGADGSKQIVVGGHASDGNPDLWMSGVLDPAPGDYTLSSLDASHGVPQLLGASPPTVAIHIASSGTDGSTAWKLSGVAIASQLSTYPDPSSVSGRLWLSNEDGLDVFLIQPLYTISWASFQYAGSISDGATTFTEAIKGMAAGHFDPNASTDLALLTETNSQLRVSVIRAVLDVNGTPSFSTTDTPMVVPDGLDHATARVAVVDVAMELTGFADEILVYDAAGNAACLDPNSDSTDCGQAALVPPE